MVNDKRGQGKIQFGTYLKRIGDVVKFNFTTSPKKKGVNMKQNTWTVYTNEQKQELKGITERYKACLDAGKTERECVELSVRMAEDAGYRSLTEVMAAGEKLKAGDKVYAYFIGGDNVRARRFTVSGIFQTNLTQFDQSICYTDLYTATKLNNWLAGQCSGAEISVKDFDKLDEVYNNIIKNVNRTTDKYGNVFTSKTINEAYPQIFSWLELLDINVLIILVLMVCVAGFTMISGLLIIILERTQMIGILKAMGAPDKTVRKTFLWFAAFIIGKGLLLGNILGIGLTVLQQQTGFIKLDAETYYVSTAPMEVSVPAVIAINAATILICLLVLIAPSHLVSHIHPAKSMRYE